MPLTWKGQPHWTQEEISPPFYMPFCLISRHFSFWPQYSPAQLPTQIASGLKNVVDPTNQFTLDTVGFQTSWRTVAKTLFFQLSSLAFFRIFIKSEIIWIKWCRSLKLYGCRVSLQPFRFKPSVKLLASNFCEKCFVFYQTQTLRKPFCSPFCYSQLLFALIL